MTWQQDVAFFFKTSSDAVAFKHRELEDERMNPRRETDEARGPRTK